MRVRHFQGKKEVWVEHGLIHSPDIFCTPAKGQALFAAMKSNTDPGLPSSRRAR